MISRKPQNRSLFSQPVPKTPEKRPWYRAVGAVLWRALKGACMTIGAAILISAAVSLIMLSQLTPQRALPSLPDEMVLYLELEGGISEIPAPPDFTDPFAPPQPTLRGLVDTIDRAAADPRVKGMMARLHDGYFEPAHIEELRAAIHRFREAGKFTTIFANSYGGFGGGLTRYYFASAFENIWLQPMGLVGITGLSFEMPFARTLLEKLGVTPNFAQRKDYKSVNENFTRNEMSAENREQLGALTQDWAAQMLTGIAADRKLNPDYLKARIDEGLFTAPQALQARLVDNVGYIDVLADSLIERITGEPESEEQIFVGLEHYAAVTAKRAMAPSIRPQVALVYASGAIMETGGAPGIAAADEIAPAIMDAAYDDSIQAVVLRIDSPGGSPIASEAILRALHKAREKGKAIIVSLGPVAASGGYWIALAGDQIFTSQTTITGSIGVAGGKFVLRDLMQNIGVSWDGPAWGENAGMWSFNQAFTPAQQARFEMMLDHVYDSFITRVAEGRDMTPEQAEAVAQGRVWSGSAALENGLADQEGGLSDALDYTAQQLLDESADRHDLQIVVLPKPLSVLEQFAELLATQVSIGQWWQQIKTQITLLQTRNSLTYAPF